MIISVSTRKICPYGNIFCTGLYSLVQDYIRLYGNISVSIRIYPSIFVEYPSVRDYIRLYAIISVSTRLYPAVQEKSAPMEIYSARDYIYLGQGFVHLQ